ncbi:hypothetical protein PR202_ga14810 [Eleusine coracana subsp. coracana]|uniref:Uncharacterized protein n=1 Tax=Eleusine coracana subsp. coracana TaxID=191504 RepID=A0AAV5CIH3_ELECO|nr:hypothetical protein PR202_ga14810 [Eleusine coracana subsp. coracana]
MQSSTSRRRRLGDHELRRPHSTHRSAAWYAGDALYAAVHPISLGYWTSADCRMRVLTISSVPHALERNQSLQSSSAGDTVDSSKSQ